MFQAIKRNTLAIALGSLLFSGVALAQPPGGGYMQPMRMHDHMQMEGAGCHRGHEMWRHGMGGKGMALLNMVQDHAYALKLTDKQASEIAVWRNQHLKEAVEGHKALRKDFMDLHEAALAGRDRAALDRIATLIDHQRAKMLAMGIDQVELLRKVLTPEQWKQATDWAKHFDHFKMRAHEGMRPQMTH